MRKHFDNLWKGLIEDLFIDFLRFINPGADSILDFEKGVQFLDKELEQTYSPESNNYSPNIVDKLAKVFTHEGREEWILVHIEVQDQYRNDFGKRMFRYYYRLFDKHDKPITAYAIFIEPNLTERTDIFEKGFMGTNLKYQYNTLKIANQDGDILFASENPFALAVLIAKSSLLIAKINDKEQHDKTLLLYKRRLTRELLLRKMPKNKILALMRFLQLYVIFENEELNATFDSEVKLLIEKNNNTMGIEEQVQEYFRQKAKAEGKTEGRKEGKTEGRKEGKTEGRREGKTEGRREGKEIVVKNLIAKLGLSDQQIMDAAEVKISYVKRIRKSLLYAQ